MNSQDRSRHVAVEHYRRTGTIIPGYAAEIAAYRARTGGEP